MFKHFKELTQHLEWWELPFMVLMLGITVAAMIEEYSIWQFATLCWMMAAFLHRCTGAFYENAARELIAINHKQHDLVMELIDKVKKATDP